MLVRTQKDFPGPGEILSPFAIGHLVAGFMRGSHNGPLMPVKQNSGISFLMGRLLLLPQRIVCTMANSPKR